MIRLRHALRWLLCSLLALSLSASIASAKGSSSKGGSKSGGEKTVHVREYTKKDGTHVRAHDRTPPEPKGSSSTEAEHERSGSARSSGSASSGARSVAAERDENGKIKRSAAAKEEFMRSTGYPHGRPGYVVDHVVPLACGGADPPPDQQVPDDL